jgi:hypothetical protein
MLLLLQLLQLVACRGVAFAKQCKAGEMKDHQLSCAEALPALSLEESWLV